jgi:hypothetical protein
MLIVRRNSATSYSAAMASLRLAAGRVKLKRHFKPLPCRFATGPGESLARSKIRQRAQHPCQIHLRVAGLEALRKRGLESALSSGDS